LDKSINLLSNTCNVLNEKFKDGITQSILKDDIIFNKIEFTKYGLSKTGFKQVIADASYIDDFEIEMATPQLKQSIITLFNTNMNTKILLKKIGINIMSNRILDDQTVFLDEEQVKLLFEKAPYLVSMATVDWLNYLLRIFFKNIVVV